VRSRRNVPCRSSSSTISYASSSDLPFSISLSCLSTNEDAGCCQYLIQVLQNVLRKQSPIFFNLGYDLPVFTNINGFETYVFRFWVPVEPYLTQTVFWEYQFPWGKQATYMRVSSNKGFVGDPPGCGTFGMVGGGFIAISGSHSGTGDSPDRIWLHSSSSASAGDFRTRHSVPKPGRCPLNGRTSSAHASA